MSITEVKIYKISKEEKYYKDKAEQYLADFSEKEEEKEEKEKKYKWKRIIRDVFYPDLASSRFPLRGEESKEARIFINPIEYKTWDIAFNAAKVQADVDMKQHNKNISIDTRGGKIMFEVYMGSEPLPRGRTYRPNEVIPSSREKFWRYTYEVIEL